MARGLGALFAAAWLASCGGGGQVTTYVPSRVLAFGDESSVINNDGSKYTVNAVSATNANALDCTGNPIWVQSVANIYGQSFPQCPNLNATSDPVSQIYATNGAKVADLAAQIDAHLGTGDTFVSSDLVLVLVGTNDVIAQFAQYDGSNEADLSATLDAAGAELASQVNRIATIGAKVIVSTIPNLGRSPLSGDRTDPTNPNPGVLSRLSTTFNDSLLANLLNDGHKIGLVQLDQYVIAVDNQVQNNIFTSYANTTLPACLSSVPITRCTANTLVADAVNASWLWADKSHLSATGQLGLGSLAVTRAQNNPF